MTSLAMAGAKLLPDGKQSHLKWYLSAKCNVWDRTHLASWTMGLCSWLGPRWPPYAGVHPSAMSLAQTFLATGPGSPSRSPLAV